jgi:hypothetical protein
MFLKLLAPSCIIDVTYLVAIIFGYFMFLKLLAPSSIIVVACTGLLNMFLNFELEISMLLKLIQVA